MVGVPKSKGCQICRQRRVKVLVPCCIDRESAASSSYQSVDLCSATYSVRNALNAGVMASIALATIVPINSWTKVRSFVNDSRKNSFPPTT